MPLAFPFEISNRRGVRKYTLRIKVCQCYQPHYSARLSLKQTFRESSFGENIVVEMAAWSEHRGVVPYQIEFLHADFLILIVTRTNEIVPASDGRSDEVDLDLFLLFGIGTPPLPDLTQFDGALGWCFVVRLHPGCMVLWAVDRFWQHCDGPVDQHRDVSPWTAPHPPGGAERRPHPETEPAQTLDCVFFRRCDCGDASGDSCCGGRPWVSDPSAETAGHRHCQGGRV